MLSTPPRAIGIEDGVAGRIAPFSGPEQRHPRRRRRKAAQQWWGGRCRDRRKSCRPRHILVCKVVPHAAGSLLEHVTSQAWQVAIEGTDLVGRTLAGAGAAHAGLVDTEWTGPRTGDAGAPPRPQTASLVPA